MSGTIELDTERLAGVEVPGFLDPRWTETRGGGSPETNISHFFIFGTADF